MAQIVGNGSGDSPSQTMDKSNSGNAIKSPDAPLEVPLDSTLRTEPIHSLITEVKLSPMITSPVTENAVRATNATNATAVTKAPLTTLNPVSLQPFTIDELRAHKLESLLSQYPNPEAAIKAREDTANELRRLLDENERKNKEIEREMEEKEKTREIERKVYARKLGKDA